MLFYWLIFLFFATGAILHRRNLSGSNGSDRRQWNFSWLIIWISLTLLIGLRHEVGGDWAPYLALLNAHEGERLASALFQRDPAYALLEWFGANVWGGIYLVNTVCAGIFSWGLLFFCQTQSRPWLALLVSVPILITVVAMGYTRQAVAIGLVMLSFGALQQRKIWLFISWIACAALFHATALLLAPLAIFFQSKNKTFKFIIVFVGAGALLALLLQDYIEILYSDYILAQYSSAGTVPRLAMNALPAIFFLIFYERYGLTDTQKKLWIQMAILALGCVILLAALPSSTAVDRLALYLIPLQIFVLSNMPNALQESDTGRFLLVCGVIAYSAAAQFTWLFWGVHSAEWLPYQFYPWEWLRG
jgi:hypothetical protein